MWISYQFLRSVDDIVNELKNDYNRWLHRIKCILNFNMRHLWTIVVSDQQVPIAIPMRIIETFTENDTYKSLSSQMDINHIVVSLWNYLISHEFFLQMRLLINCKVPEPYEYVVKPPTALANSTLEITLRCLKLTSVDSEIRSNFIRHFFSELLNGPLSHQIRYFVLHHISNEIPFNLKIEHLSDALLCKDESEFLTNNLTLQKNIWLFYSFVKLTNHQITNISTSEMTKYLKILSCLAPTLLDVIKPKLIQTEDDEEIDAMEIEIKEQEQSRNLEINSLVNEILIMLNEPHHVQSIMSLIDNESFADEILVSLSILCHSMLHCNPMSVNQYRYKSIITKRILSNFFLKKFLGYFIR